MNALHAIQALFTLLSSGKHFGGSLQSLAFVKVPCQRVDKYYQQTQNWSINDIYYHCDELEVKENKDESGHLSTPAMALAHLSPQMKTLWLVLIVCVISYGK